MTDPRALQLAEARYRNGYGPTLAEPWEQLHPDVRQDHITEAAAWLRSGIAAGLMPPAESCTGSRAAALTEAVAALEAHLESFFREWPDERQNSPWVLGWKDATAELRQLVTETTPHPAAEDLAAAENPTQLRWGLDDVQWGDDDSVIVMLSGPDREPYWLELDQERAAVLRQNLAGPDGEPEVGLRRLSPNEYTSAWHAVEGAAGEPGADPATVLHAVLRVLGIDQPVS
jgi:hypothetical protein